MKQRLSSLLVVSLVFGTFASIEAGGYSTRGLLGKNDPASPAYRYILWANLIEAWNPLDGSTLSSTLSPVTCDINSYGRNGRDQAEPFPPTTWVRFYVTRSSSSAPACLTSLAPPATGPTLQGGDTHWGYVGTLRLSSGGFVPTRMYGSWMKFVSFLNILSNGAATTETEVDISGSVPPDALEWLGMRSFYITASLSNDPYPGTICFTQFMGHVPAAGPHRSIFDCLNGLTPGAAQILEGHDVVFPVSEPTKFYYWWEVYRGILQYTPGIGGLSIDLYGYKVPNGGE